MQKDSKFLIFSSFWLKLFAIITMTLDHTGVVLEMFFSEYPIVGNIVPILRIIGRIALPLYCFMIVEGVLHTRNFKRYILSLSIVGGSVLIGHIFLVHVMKGSMGQGNIFLDLALGALAIYFLNHKKAYLKPIALLPIGYALFSHLTYGAFPELIKYPEYLKTQYGFYGMALILGFYIAHLLTKLYYNYLGKNVGLTYKDFNYRLVNNALNVLMLTVVTISLHVITQYGIYCYLDTYLQNYALISGALLLLYNGKRGYNSNWFKYGCYIYYPAHLLILYGLGYLIAII